MASERPASALVIEPPMRDLGSFQVRRVLPDPRRQAVGPFVFYDHLGPQRFQAGQRLDVRPHPHIGLATMTYLFEGEIVHRDSLGFVQSIRPGDVNWMVAGRGIVHSERSPPRLSEASSALHGIQSWIALPRGEEERAPAFHHHPGDSLPVIQRDGMTLRVAAGEAFGERAAVQVASPLFFVAADCDAGASLTLPAALGERAVHVVSGAVAVGGGQHGEGRMIVLQDGDDVALTTPVPSRLILLGGAALDGPRHLWWNFVSSSTARIEQAKSDWAGGRFAAVPGETEFIPLPD